MRELKNLARFDYDLSLDLNDLKMKTPHRYLKPEIYFSQGLNKKQRERILNNNTQQ